MNYWMLLSSPENFEISRNLGFELAGMKSRHRKKAIEVNVGDKIVFYMTKIGCFGGTAKVVSAFYEDSKKIWLSDKPDEVYPFRFKIKPEVILDSSDFVRSDVVGQNMEYTKKWPKEHWKLAFQGNVHRLPEHDYLLIKKTLEIAKK